jgi:RecA/RadA recombinase
MSAVLSVRDLRVRYPLGGGLGGLVNKDMAAFVDVVHGFSLDINRGETIAVVGESGSGKTTLAMALCGLAPVMSGKVAFHGADVPTGKHGLLELVMASHAGMTTVEFEEIVENWLATARHPERDRPYNELIYQPMLELLDYLRAHGFKTFITSGGGIEFMRPWVEEAYGIPPDQVVGSSIKVELQERDGEPVLVRLPEIDFIDDKEGKPVGIHKFIGRRPIAAFGNSDGDFQMLEWTTAGEGARLGVIIHHTDAEREWAYDRESHVGRLVRGLDEAADRGWVLVDMKNDWKTVYPAP